MNKNTVITILAIIGGLVVLGWALKLTFKLLGLLIVIGIGLAIYFAVQSATGKGK
ncbi:putative exporter [Sphingomonas sp. UYAg733]